MRARYLYFGCLTILVTAASGGFFFAPYVSTAAAIKRCAMPKTHTAQCYQELISTAAEHEGLVAAFELLSEIYSIDTSFATACHGNAHELGKIAYEDFINGKNPPMSDKTSYCGYGFYHGFLEELIVSGGTLTDAKDFCAYLESQLSSSLPSIGYSCFHGIGHGVIDGTDPSAWGDEDSFIKEGLAVCDTISDEVPQKQACAAGVFNALHNAYDDPKFGLYPDPDQPYAVCKRQSVDYARSACYDHMKMYVNKTNPVFSDALQSAYAHADPAYRETAITGVASIRAEAALLTKESLSDYVNDCNSLPNAMRATCAKGFALGLIEYGGPEQEVRTAVDACVRSSLKDSCLDGVVFGIKYRLPENRKVAGCAYIAEMAGAAEGEACRAAVR